MDAVDTVRAIVGNVSKFDFRQVSDRLPQVDLPDLASFLETALTLNGRKISIDKDRISFLTPENWLNEIGISKRYENMTFEN